MAMATTTALALASLSLAAVGTGTAFYSAVQQGKTAKATGEYNAKLAENQALQEDMEARENIRRKRDENRRLLATQRGKYAKAGVVEEGTPLEVMAESAKFLELDALEMSRQSSTRTALLRAQAQRDRAIGSSTAKAYGLQAGASLLNGASQAAGGYLSYKKSGAF
jgi:hypothetical protein